MPKDISDGPASTSLTQLKARPRLRKPGADDGADIWDLVRACAPLDENSMYCNLLQCDHFRDTCVLAEIDGRTLGWISAYIPPSDPGTIFVWQVAVHADARGHGLGKRMLAALLDRPECRDVARMRTTITRDNAASWALFRGFARSRGARLHDAPHFERDDHFDGRHATEHMVTIDLEEAARQAA